MEQDTSMSPDNESTEKPENGVYASVSSLTEDGVEPNVGDKVSVQVEGSIHSIDNGVACVTPETVNGEPAPDMEKSEPTGDDLRSALEGAQQGQPGY